MQFKSKSTMKQLYLIIVFFLLLIPFTKISSQELEVSPTFCCNSFFLNGEQIDKKEFNMLLEKDEQAYEIWKKSKTNEILAFTDLALAVGFAIWTINEIPKDDPNLVPAVGALVTSVVGILLMSKAKKNKQKAVNTFNQNINKTAFRVQPSSKGFGVTLSIN